MRCTVTGRPYTVFGYNGKQVRDNIHSADLIHCFHEFFKNPRSGEVYNIGGGRFSNASMMESIKICEEVSGRKLNHTYKEDNRTGDHIWWISAVSYTHLYLTSFPDGSLWSATCTRFMCKGVTVS